MEFKEATPFDTTLFWLKIHRCPGLGLKSWYKFLTIIPSQRYSISLDQWKKLGLSRLTWENFHNKDLEQACIQELKWALNHQVLILDWESKYYPRSLKQSSWAHPVLSFYCAQANSKNGFDFELKNRLERLNGKLCWGLVGSRKSTREAKSKLEHLFEWATVSSPLCLVSGLAIGVDTLAHQFANKKGLDTVALIGEGLEHYLQKKSPWHKPIIIASQFPYQMSASKSSFPLRNQVIAGMCEGLMVLESQSRGGSLITAQMALDDGKTIWAHPGTWNSPLAQGTLKLIQSGALAMWEPKQSQDYFVQNFPQFQWHTETQGSSKDAPSILTELDELSQKVYWEISSGAQSIDQLLAILKIPPNTLISSLATLEILDLAYSNRQNNWSVYE